jgi:surface antigen
MTLKTLLAAATAIAAITISAAAAQPYGPGRDQNGYDNQRDNNQRDPSNYYSQTDQNGYYDRNGHYQRMRGQYDPRDNRGPRADAGAYYQEGAYEQNCQRGNAAAGTIFGALAGGLIGSAVSHGNGGAVVGGAVLGGLLGNTVSKDIDCNDQPYAFRVYSDGLNGDVGRRYNWNHGQARGYFVPTREYRRGGVVCRDFTETTYRGDRELTHAGTACRAQDGNWRFD